MEAIRYRKALEKCNEILGVIDSELAGKTGTA